MIVFILSVSSLLSDRNDVDGGGSRTRANKTYLSCAVLTVCPIIRRLFQSKSFKVFAQQYKYCIVFSSYKCP